MSATVTILIGNTDNKLTQQEWAEFCEGVSDVALRYASSVQFSGASNGTAPWQNACWVIVLEGDYAGLTTRLGILAHHYKQDSIAVVVGATEFVASTPPREGSKGETNE